MQRGDTDHHCHAVSEQCNILSTKGEFPVKHVILLRPFHICLTQDRIVFADNARANFFKPGGDHLTLLSVYNEVCSMLCISLSGIDHLPAVFSPGLSIAQTLI